MFGNLGSIIFVMVGPFSCLSKIVLDNMCKLVYKSEMEITLLGEERYELDLEGDNWALYRQAVGDQNAYLIKESQDINEIFVAMYRDKASRGKGSSMRIG